jgi:hypothetical protein
MYSLDTIKKLNGEYPEDVEDPAQPVFLEERNRALFPHETILIRRVTSAIIAYEQGELDEPEVIELFQYLVDSGLAWELQGSYGRAAVAYIEAGLVVRR